MDPNPTPLNARAWQVYGGEVAFFATLLFSAAGTTDWPAAWIFLLLYSGTTLWIGMMLARSDPTLLRERLEPLMQRDQPWWDKLCVAAMMVLWPPWLILMGLDAVRFGWSSMPLWLRVAGAGGMLLAAVLMVRTYRANTFLSPVVKVQTDRDHVVVSTGPYALVRHPLYAATTFYLPSIALLLGSWCGLIASTALVLVVIVRTVMEDRLLTHELDGYEAYAARVRHRLVPFVW